jgi:hypothetical protein
MVFRTTSAIAWLLIGLGGAGGQALARYYPYTQAYPSQGYPTRQPLPSVADGDDDAPPINAPVVQGPSLPPIGAPSGPTTHFERGKTSADFEEPAPVPTVLAEARKPAKRGTSGAASAAFDGRWSVVIGTRSGPCDPQYRFGVRIINGNITYEGGGAGNAQGRVLPSGSVTVSVASGPNAASGQGRLTQNYGTGTWRGQGPGGVCSGAWQAWRQ